MDKPVIIFHQEFVISYRPLLRSSESVPTPLLSITTSHLGVLITPARSNQKELPPWGCENLAFPKSDAVYSEAIREIEIITARRYDGGVSLNVQAANFFPRTNRREQRPWSSVVSLVSSFARLSTNIHNRGIRPPKRLSNNAPGHSSLWLPALEPPGDQDVPADRFNDRQCSVIVHFPIHLIQPLQSTHLQVNPHLEMSQVLTNHDSKDPSRFHSQHVIWTLYPRRLGFFASPLPPRYLRKEKIITVDDSITNPFSRSSTNAEDEIYTYWGQPGGREKVFSVHESIRSKINLLLYSQCLESSQHQHDYSRKACPG